MIGERCMPLMTQYRWWPFVRGAEEDPLSFGCISIIACGLKSQSKWPLYKLYLYSYWRCKNSNHYHLLRKIACRLSVRRRIDPIYSIILRKIAEFLQTILPFSLLIFVTVLYHAYYQGFGSFVFSVIVAWHPFLLMMGKFKIYRKENTKITTMLFSIISPMLTYL